MTLTELFASVRRVKLRTNRIINEILEIKS